MNHLLVGMELEDINHFLEVAWLVGVVLIGIVMLWQELKGKRKHDYPVTPMMMARRYLLRSLRQEEGISLASSTPLYRQSGRSTSDLLCRLARIDMNENGVGMWRSRAMTPNAAA